LLPQDFLVKFFTKNYERSPISDRHIRGFNFLMHRGTVEGYTAIDRVSKATENDITVICKLLQTLLANMEENLKNPTVVPYLNDGLFVMMGYIYTCLSHFNDEKVLKAEQWQQVEQLVDLFGYARKWQNIGEADLVDMIDKQIPAMNWVDEVPDL
jgi:hypothetical protein